VNELRWILLIVGIVVLAVIYVIGRKEQLRRRQRWQEDADLNEDAGGVSLDTRFEHEEIAPEPEHFDRLEDMLHEEDDVRRPEPQARSARVVQINASGPAPEQKVQRREIRTAERPPPTSDKIISLYVVARRPAIFKGEAIRDAAERLNLEYGDMQIFNRVIERNGRRHIVFSIANAVQPGTFDLDSLPGLATPALALFMQLPGPLEGLKAFNAMVDCAQRLALELDAELQDATHSALTNQTIDHMREEIQLFSLRTARIRGRAP
jgi:cell division protein ZipA